MFINIHGVKEKIKLLLKKLITKIKINNSITIFIIYKPTIVRLNMLITYVRKRGSCVVKK